MSFVDDLEQEIAQYIQDCNTKAHGLRGVTNLPDEYLADDEDDVMGHLVRGFRLEKLQAKLAEYQARNEVIERNCVTAGCYDQCDQMRKQLQAMDIFLFNLNRKTTIAPEAEDVYDIRYDKRFLENVDPGLVPEIAEVLITPPGSETDDEERPTPELSDRERKKQLLDRAKSRVKELKRHYAYLGIKEIRKAVAADLDSTFKGQDRLSDFQLGKLLAFPDESPGYDATRDRGRRARGIKK